MRRLALGLCAPALILGSLVTGLAPSTAAPTESPIRVWTPNKLTVVSYGGSIYDDFGIRLIAGSQPFEVRSHRTSYSQPIKTDWISPTGAVALPDGSMSTFEGLDDFLAVRVRRASDDKFVTQTFMPGCLNGFGERSRPDAPPRSLYPDFCPTNPYTVGSVMGIQAGWAISPIRFGSPLNLKPGTYKVTAYIPTAYREIFGISAADARHDMTLTVVTDSAKPRPAARADRHPVANKTKPAGTRGGVIAGPTPDLRALPSAGIELNKAGTVLRFGATVWNGGNSPLVIDGFRRPDADIMDAYQYFFDTSGNQTGYQQVGTLEWHAGNHNHWHFEDFAKYELLNADKTVAVKSTKQSFCLANTDAVDYTVDGADWHPQNTDLSTACGGYGAQSVREVLSAGSGDTYYQYRTGQAFAIKTLPNGVYFIRTTANPLGNLVESDTTNNVSLRKIRIGGTPDKRTLKVFQVGIIKESGCFFRSTVPLARGC